MKKLLLLACTLLSTAAFAESPVAIGIDSLSYSGNGCPRESVASNISSDGQAITIMFDQFVIATEDHPRLPILSKFCKVNLGLNIPEGWSYSLFRLQYRGYASLDEGITGIQSTMVKHNGRGRAFRIAQMTLEGEFDDDYEKTTILPVSDYNWSPCTARSAS